jgi:hypothetical protein
MHLSDARIRVTQLDHYRIVASHMSRDAALRWFADLYEGSRLAPEEFLLLSAEHPLDGGISRPSMKSMSCPDCGDKGEPGGCDECGRKRELTAEEKQFAEWDRQDAAKSACTVYARHMHVTCSLGTKGCTGYHGR